MSSSDTSVEFARPTERLPPSTTQGPVLGPVVARSWEWRGRAILWATSLRRQANLLVNGKLMLMLDKNPSGGYRTNGSVNDGVMTSRVPGGNANRPSVVIHSRRFCRECGTSSPSCRWSSSSAPVTLFSNHINSNNTVHKDDIPKFFIPENENMVRLTCSRHELSFGKYWLFPRKRGGGLISGSLSAPHSHYLNV